MCGRRVTYDRRQPVGGGRTADLATLSLAAKILFLARGSATRSGAPIVAAEEDRIVLGFLLEPMPPLGNRPDEFRAVSARIGRWSVGDDE